MIDMVAGMCCSVVWYADVCVLFSLGGNVNHSLLQWVVKCLCFVMVGGFAYLVLCGVVCLRKHGGGRNVCVCVVFCWPVRPWLKWYMCRYSLYSVDNRSWQPPIRNNSSVTSLVFQISVIDSSHFSCLRFLESHKVECHNVPPIVF